MSFIDTALEKIPVGWEELFVSQQETFHRIKMILEEDGCMEITPDPSDIFKVFDMILPENIRVIIIGQDPYPEIGVANGIAFSTHSYNSVPKSLSNIFKEVQRCYPSWDIPSNGDLSEWVLQGVFLLNTSLTRDTSMASGPNQHFSKKLWLPFIISVISYIKSKNKEVLFVTWGKSAQETLKSCGFRKIDSENLFSSSHPSPLAKWSKDPFEGCEHFSKINKRLKELGWAEINW